MPEKTSLFNPYRWVRVERTVAHAKPSYHHRLAGQWGRFRCKLTAMTPLFVGRGSGNAVFLTSKIDGREVATIPGTTLKGVIRSIAEVVSASAVAHSKHVDQQYQPSNASRGVGLSRELDLVSRLFGTLQGQKEVYMGAVQFSDAPLVDCPELSNPNQWPMYKVVVGNPKPSHRAFYPSTQARKFYHHRSGATTLQQTNLSQKRDVRPAPVGSTFEFDVEYRGLSDEELSLLVYCLVLESEVQVELSEAATDEPGGVTLAGPMCHKVGACKPAGGGSSRIEIMKWTRFPDAENRYRSGGNRQAQVIEGAELDNKIGEVTAATRNRNDVTMLDLRAMMVYDENDPRAANLSYPSNEWFRENSQHPLRPTR